MGQHSMQLTSIGPCSGLIITAQRSFDGWEIKLRHAHHGGGWADCELEVYERLSSDELLQVLGGVVAGLLAVPGPGDHCE